MVSIPSLNSYSIQHGIHLVNDAPIKSQIDDRAEDGMDHSVVWFECCPFFVLELQPFPSWFLLHESDLFYLHFGHLKMYFVFELSSTLLCHLLLQQSRWLWLELNCIWSILNIVPSVNLQLCFLSPVRSVCVTSHLPPSLPPSLPPGGIHPVCKTQQVLFRKWQLINNEEFTLCCRTDRGRRELTPCHRALSILISYL